MGAEIVTDENRWRRYLFIGLIASLAAALSGSVTAMGVIALLTGTTAAVVGARLARAGQGKSRDPWRLFTAGACLFIAATVGRVIHGVIAGSPAGTAPFPSPVDALAIAGYLCLIVGGTLLGHLRSPDRDEAAIIDGAIIAIGLQMPLWALVLGPHIVDPSVPISQRVLNASYSTLTTLLVAVIGRLAVGPGARTIAYRLLAGAVITIVVQDALTTLNSVDGLPIRLDRMLAAPCFVLFGAAALHPDRLRIAEASAGLHQRLTTKRIFALVLSLLIPPLVILIQGLSGTEPNMLAAVATMSILIALVTTRFGLLARVQERATALRTIQRDANGELATASTRQGTHMAALRAAARLITDPAARISLAEVVDDELVVTESTGTAATSAVGTRAHIDDLPVQVAAGLDDLRVVVMGGARPVDLVEGPAATRRTHLFVAPLTTHGELTGAMIVSTPGPLEASARESLEMLVGTLSLALESASLAENLTRRRSERRFRALVEHSSEIVFVVDEDLSISFVSPAVRRLLGVDDDDLLGTHPARWVHRADWASLAERIEAAGDDDAEVEVRLTHVDGSHRWFEVRTKDLRHDVEIEGVVVTAREISDRKATEAELANQEARYRALVQNSSDAIAIIGDDGCWNYVSPAVRTLLGWEPEHLIGRRALDSVAPEALATFRGLYPQLGRGHVGDELEVTRFDTSVVRRNGEIRHVTATITDMRHEPAVRGLVLNVRDDTERNRLERDLRYQALHDSLTGLPNRTLFARQVTAALETAADDRSELGVIVVDLDDFKTVNDSLGHAAGDELLQVVSRRLFRVLGTEDLIARLGGDEFGVLVVDVDGARTPQMVGERILRSFEDPFVIGSREVDVSVSLGIAVSTGDRSAEVLLRSADTAMYRAKDEGKGKATLFVDELHADAFDRFEMKADLNRAIERDQLVCRYQPIVSLQTGRITGLEALVRWNHPERGMIPPAMFIPLSEETGHINAIGRFVLQEACQQLAEWQLMVSAYNILSMSVNLSVRQLNDPGLVDDVRDAIADAGIDPSTLTLEITESTLMSNTEENIAVLERLRAIGVSLAVDDFGTGYSSLGYAKRLPIDIIKIDRSFVADLGTAPGDTAVVKAMIDLAGSLGVHTVAEGIDRPEQIKILQELGADNGQGYLFSPPTTPEAMTEVLGDPSAVVIPLPRA